MNLEFLTTNLWPVEVKETQAETVDEYQGLNNLLDNIVVQKPRYNENVEQEKARNYLKTVQFQTLTASKKGFIIGGEMGYLSLFELDPQL